MRRSGVRFISPAPFHAVYQVSKHYSEIADVIFDDMHFSELKKASLIGRLFLVCLFDIGAWRTFSTQ